MSIKLPFRLQLNAPISKVLGNQQEPIRSNKQLPFAINRLYKQKLKDVLKSIKNHQIQSPASYFKFILASAKQAKKQSKTSYLPYNTQQLPNQPQVPKTVIFNLRVKSIKSQAFLKLKKFFLDVKTYQVSSVLQNRQSELLNHLIPKIEEKVYTIAFRAIMDYSKEQKGKTNIVKLLDKLSNNIAKRVHFSEFLNKIKSHKSKQSKAKLACQKIAKIIKLSQRFVVQSSLRKIQLYQQSLSLEKKLSQKKERISKIYDMNAQRTTVLQKQRQALRNLKYKLDQQSVEKNHVMTQKRRSLMLARTKFTEQSKQLTDQILNLSVQVYKLTVIFQKQSHIILTLNSKRNSINQLKRRGIDFESITLSVYKAIHDLGEEGLNGFLQMVKHHEQKWNHVENMTLLDTIVEGRDYQCRKIAFLEKIIRSYERKQPQSQLNASRFKPSSSTISTSQLKFSPSASSLKGSRVVSSSIVGKLKALSDPPELIRLKEQYTTLQSLISLILSKSYEIKIKQAIAAEIEQLSELLASDIKENQE